MKYSLDQIENLKPRNGVSLACSQFFIAIFCEYLISYCGYGVEGNDFYSLIKKKFTSSEISESTFLCKLYRINEVAELGKVFPIFNVSGKFDQAALESFLASSSIEIQNEENVFDFAGHKYRWKRLFVNVIEKDGKPFACAYACRLGNGIWQKCGSAAPMDKAALVEFESLNPVGAAGENKVVTISEEQFFKSPESPSDLRELDREQKVAVSAPIDKNVLILAGAGSGKTRCLVSRLAYLHLVKGVPLDKIVLLTFTKNVASEMRERAANLMLPIYAQYYPNSEPTLDVRTIDSFFVKTIRSFYQEIGFKNDSEPLFFLSTDREDKSIIDKKISVLREIVANNGLEAVFSYYFTEPEDEVVARARQKSLLKKLENYMIGLPVNQSGIQELLDLYLDWQLLHNEVLGFESAQKLIQKSLEDPLSRIKDKITSQYKCILIDEFQDISILQNKVFSFFYDGSIHFTFCGDDDQTIYGFRGSDNAIIQAISKMPNVINAPLMTNYRSDPTIVEAANAILNIIEGRAKTVKMKTALTTKNKIHHATYSNDFSELVSEIGRLIESGTKPNDILILFRSNSTSLAPNGRNESESELLYNALTAANIQVKRPDPSYELGPNYDLFCSIFSIVIGFNTVESVAKIRNCLGLSGSRYSDIVIQNVILGKDEPDDNLAVIAYLGEVVRTASDKSLADVIDRYALKAGELFEGAANRLHSDPLFEELRYAAIDHSMPWPLQQGRFRNFLKAFEGRFRKQKTRAKKSSENGVRINTIHKAKGLQAKCVFIIDLEAGKIPNTTQIDKDYEYSRNELNSIKSSKRKFVELKQTINDAIIDTTIEELKSAGSDEREKELLGDFSEVFDFDSSFRRRLRILDSYAIEQFNYSFKTTVSYLDGRYERKLKEIETTSASLRQKLDNLIDQKKECASEGVEFSQESAELLEKTKVLIDEKEESKKRFILRYSLFKKSTFSTRELFKICSRAASYLLDMGRENDLEKLEADLLRRKEKAINEERRVFYVAVTRAETSLYLMHPEGTNPSEFITMIPKNLIQDDKFLTKSQRDDLGIQIKEVNETIQESDSEQIAKSDLVISIQDENVQRFVDSFIQGFVKEHPYCSELTGDAKFLFELALKHDCISKMTGIPNELAIATCFERSIIELYKERIGGKRQSIRIRDADKLRDAVGFLCGAMRSCKTNPLGKNTIRSIFNPIDERSDVSNTLKGLSAIAFYVNCNPHGLFQNERSVWGNICKTKDRASFKKIFVGSIDLMNYRNYVVHEDQSGWPVNLLINVFKTYLEVVKNVFGG